MLSTDLMRSGAVGFGLGGVAWIVSGLLVVFGKPIVGPHPVYFLFVLVALLLTSVGLMGLHALQEVATGASDEWAYTRSFWRLRSRRWVRRAPYRGARSWGGSCPR